MSEKPQILIVDDKEQNLIALEKVLSESDAVIIRAESGNEALKAALNHDFALAILDVQMPGMDGYELAEHLRNDGKTREMPIIFMSAAYTDDFNVFNGYKAGAIDYIVKPYNPHVLRSKANFFLEFFRQKLELKKHRDHLESLVNERTAEVRREIEERKRAEQESERLNIELVQKNKELEQIIYVTSHDLRSPLVNVQGFSKELDYSADDLISSINSDDFPEDIKKKIKPILEKDIPESLQFIRRSISKMDKLLSGILRLSRMGSDALKKENLDMNRIINDVSHDLEFKFKEKGAKLEIKKLPHCTGDTIQIDQLFSNLINNALKFLDTYRSGVIKISGRKEKGKSIYCVEDNGIGIAPEYHDKIFEIFHRLNPKEREGEGLGLTIVRRILDRYNGNIWVESEVGKGSRFYVQLPGA